jgi:Flp pilus assembly protein TadG
MRRAPQSAGCAAGSRRLNGEAGSTLVEFAFVFMLLMAMLLGIVDFGRALYAYHFISGAARQATRWAAVNGATCGAPPLGDNSCTAPITCSSGSCTPCTNYGSCLAATPADVRNYVKMLAQGADIDSSGTDCGGSACLVTTPTWNPAGSGGPTVCATTTNAPGCTVEVQVQYNFNFLAPFVHSSVVTMSSTSEMVIAH